MNQPSSSAHLSDLQLDQLLAGELAGAEAAPLDQHLATCLSCRRRLRDLQDGAEAFAAAAPALRAEAVPPRRSRHGRFMAGAALLVAAAGLVLVLRPQASPTDGPATRTKGPGLAVNGIIERDGEQWPVIDGDAIAPGDRLQLTYSAERPGYLVVLGRDPAGTTSLYMAEAIAAGRDIPLPFAIEFDDVRGREELHLVRCEAAIDAAQMERDLATTGAIAGTPGCQPQMLWLDKR